MSIGQVRATERTCLHLLSRFLKRLKCTEKNSVYAAQSAVTKNDHLLFVLQQVAENTKAPLQN